MDGPAILCPGLISAFWQKVGCPIPTAVIFLALPDSSRPSDSPWPKFLVPGGRPKVDHLSNPAEPIEMRQPKKSSVLKVGESGGYFQSPGNVDLVGCAWPQSPEMWSPERFLLRKLQWQEGRICFRCLVEETN